MNSVASQKSKTKNIKQAVPEQMPVEQLPSNRSVLDTLYNHYGKPENIVKESVKLYTHYVSHAGHISPDWVVDGWQQGRVTIFTGHKECEDDLFYKTKIDHSWFIAVKDNRVKVRGDDKVDIILEIGE
jgi:hypothetical protein